MATLRRYVFRGEIRRPEVPKPHASLLDDDAHRLARYLMEEANREGGRYDEEATVEMLYALGPTWRLLSALSVGALYEAARAWCQQRQVQIPGVRINPPAFTGRAPQAGLTSEQVSEFIQRTQDRSRLVAGTPTGRAPSYPEMQQAAREPRVRPVRIENVDLADVELGAIARSLQDDAAAATAMALARDADRRLGSGTTQISPARPLNFYTRHDGTRGYPTALGHIEDHIDVSMGHDWVVTRPGGVARINIEVCDPSIRVSAQDQGRSLRGRFHCDRNYSLGAYFTQLDANLCAQEVYNYLEYVGERQLVRWAGDNVSHISITNNVRCWPRVDNPERAIALFRTVVNMLPQHKRLRSFLVNLACVIWYRSAGSPTAGGRVIRPLQDAIRAYDRHIGELVVEDIARTYPFFRNWGDLRGFVACMAMELVPRSDRSPDRIRRMLDIATDRVLAPLYEQDKQAAWGAIMERAEHHWDSRE